jgi:anti-anti-sigma regulatory factor
MYFANSAYVKDQVTSYVNNLSKVDPIHYVVLDMTAVTSVDSSAAHALEELIQDFQSRAIKLAFTNVSGRVMGTLRRAHVIHHLGEEWVFSTVHVAVQGWLKYQRDKSLSMPRKDAEPKQTSEGDNSTEEGSDSNSGTTVELGEEVSISNGMHDKYTVVHINTHRGRANMLVDLMKIFIQYGVSIIRAEVEKQEIGNSTLMCFWVANHVDGKAKLTSVKIEELKRDIDRWLEELPNANHENNVAHFGLGSPAFEKQISNNDLRMSI